MLRGIAASSGIGIGEALLAYNDDLVVLMETGRDPSGEKRRFFESADVFADEIKKASSIIQEKAGRDEADILRTQIEIARDPELVNEIMQVLDERRVNLEYAFNIVCDKYIRLFSGIADDFLRARTADFIDFRDHVLMILMKKKPMDFSHAPRGSVIVTKDIPPSSAASIDPVNIAGIVTQRGSSQSHIAIIARAMGLPAIVAVEGILDQVKDGDLLVLDGDLGEVVSNPDMERLHRYKTYYSILS